MGVHEAERKITPLKGQDSLNNRLHKTNGSNQRESRKSEGSAASFNRWLQDMTKSTNASTVQMAEDALMKRIHSGDSYSYNTVSFNSVLNGWSHQKSAYAATRADELLHKLLALQQQSSHDHLQADTYSYSAVLNAYAKSNGGKTAALRAEELLIQMQTTLFPQRSITNLKTDACHTAVINAWSLSGDPQAGERAESILRSLPFLSQIPYNVCIKAYARSQAPIEAQRLLEEMRNLANSSHPELEPDKISICTCIDAWSKWNKNLTYAAQRAEELLQQMERDYEVWNKTQRMVPEIQRVDNSKKQQHRSTSSSKQPDIVTYTAVLTAYARAGLADADKAIQLIRRMEHYSNGRPNAQFFNTVIHSLATSKGSRGNTSSSTPQQLAEGVLRHMKKEFYESRNEDIRPGKITYTAVIAVYGSHYDRGLAAAKRAEALLNELEHLYNNTNLDLYLPNTKTFGAVLSIWAKAASMSMSHEEDESISAEWLWHRTESLLERMERLYHRTRSAELKPTSILYSQVFRILANGRDPQAATRGLKLMQKMKSMIADNTGYGDQIRLDSTMYAYLIVTFTKSKVENVVEVATQILQQVEEGYNAGMGSLKPTSLLYSAVLQAYAKSSSKEGAILAEDLLERTKMLYKQGKLYAKPTTLFYNAVMDAHARSDGGREAAERAEQLLEEMELRGRAGDSELRPTTRSFNAAILAWKNSNATDASQRAETLLANMTKRYKDGDERCRPDRVTINSVISVLAKSPQANAAERAHRFLYFMETLSKSGDIMKPDRYSYNSVIDAYARSTEPGAARIAQALCERMQARYEQGEKDLLPDLITYSSLRLAWMASNDTDAQGHVRRIGIQILQEVDRQKKVASAAAGKEAL